MSVSKNGGRVIYDYQYDPESNSSPSRPIEPVPKWLSDLLGLDYMATVTQVTLLGPLPVDRIELSSLKSVPCLAIVDIPVDDLSPLSNFKNLKNLSLNGIVAGDLTPLANLTRLQRIAIFDNTSVTDHAPLHGLSNLKHLWLDKTPNVSDQEIARLKHALPNCRVTKN